MSRPEAPADDARRSFPVRVWSRSLRAAAGGAAFVALANVPLLLAAVVLATDPPVTPALLLEAMAVWIALPAGAAAALAHVSRGRLDVDAQMLVLESGRQRVEVPRDAVVAVEPWRLPLPGPGFGLRLRSGRRLAWSVETRDPDPVIAALGEPSGAARRHAVVRWAHARAAVPPRRWPHHLAKFPLFALAPSAAFFNVHQFIAYGGTFGQWYLEGLGPWLQTFAVYWATTTAYCILWAGVWRGAAEALAWTAAAVAPAHAARGRRAAEWLAAIAYWLGIPALTAARFLS